MAATKWGSILTVWRSKMRFPRSKIVLGAALFLALPATQARAHWCDDLWASAYDIVVKPDSDTSPKQIYVENRWGYQLTNFKLTATSSSGGTVTLTAPTTLKVANTLLPGEKGIWKITAGSPAKIEDLSFHVTFGDTTGSLNKQYACYPVLNASPVMVMKNDGTRFPSSITAIPKDGTDPKPNAPNGCTYGDVALGRSLQVQTIADWEDLNVGLDNLMVLYCSGRGSWGNNDKSVKPNSYCKDANNTTCPSKPTAIPGSRSDYMRLWGAGALAIRKGSLGTRLPVFRQRLKCGANDADPGISGYTMFVLGYLGEDADSKSFLQTQASATGDTGTIAKAALYLMGDTSQKSAVQAGVSSSSVWVKVACAGAVGIVDKDDSAVTSAIIPEVKWIEPDNMGGTTDNGKGMYSAHILEIVAMDRRGWAYQANGEGPVTFYGETGAAGASGKGGASGTGGGVGAGGSSGAAGSGGASSPVGTGGSTSGRGGAPGSGGATGGGGRSSGSGGATAGSSAPAGSGGSAGAGGSSSREGSGGAEQHGSGGAVGSGGASDGRGGSNGSGGSSNTGSSHGSGGGSGGDTTQPGPAGEGSGCQCKVGGRPDAAVISLLALVGLVLWRRRRH
jgi:MYXO-CTERM domain-containing protein